MAAAAAAASGGTVAGADAKLNAQLAALPLGDASSLNFLRSRDSTAPNTALGDFSEAHGAMVTLLGGEAGYSSSFWGSLGGLLLLGQVV